MANQVALYSGHWYISLTLPIAPLTSPTSTHRLLMSITLVELASNNTNYCFTPSGEPLASLHICIYIRRYFNLFIVKCYYTMTLR